MSVAETRTVTGTARNHKMSERQQIIIAHEELSRRMYRGSIADYGQIAQLGLRAAKAGHIDLALKYFEEAIGSQAQFWDTSGFTPGYGVNWNSGESAFSRVFELIYDARLSKSEIALLLKKAVGAATSIGVNKQWKYGSDKMMCLRQTVIEISGIKLPRANMRMLIIESIKAAKTLRGYSHTIGWSQGNRYKIDRPCDFIVFDEIDNAMKKAGFTVNERIGIWKEMNMKINMGETWVSSYREEHSISETIEQGYSISYFDESQPSEKAVERRNAPKPVKSEQK